MIATQALRFAYSPEKSFAFPDLHCADGQALLVLGQSGQGKTTLLHLLALLLTPQSGHIQVNGQETTTLHGAEAAAFRAANIGLVYQRPHFVRALSVLDNLLLPNYLAHRPADAAKARQLAETLGFAGLLSRKTHELSLGEQQRVGIARALMNDARLLLADEPTSSLDDVNCERVVSLLRAQAERIGASLVVVTHDARLKEQFGHRLTL